MSSIFAGFFGSISSLSAMSHGMTSTSLPRTSLYLSIIWLGLFGAGKRCTMREMVDPTVFTALVRAIAQADAAEFANQYPAYAADIAGETRTALTALRSDPVHRDRYIRFMADMVYGERPDFGVAMDTVTGLAERVW